jgi:acetyl-CoA carboxylase biotin carboxyl carrier protein
LADNEFNELDADARRTIARLAAETLPRLIERLTKSELGELEVRDDGWRIRLRKPVNGAQSGSAAARSQLDQPRRAASGTGGHTERGTSARGHQTHRTETNRGLVTSPAVGYFVPRQGVGVGVMVSRGDLVGHVDVLGVRQEVVAPIDGVLGAVEVESGQAIEYGQPIARVDAAPDGRIEAVVEA